MKRLFVALVSLVSFCLVSAQENLGLSGVVNARDIGGYKIGDKVVKKGKILRSGDLSKATDADMDILNNQYKLERVFDLRTTYEMLVAQDRQPDNGMYVNLSCLEKQIDSRRIFVTGDKKNMAPEYEEQIADLMLDSISSRKVRQLAMITHQFIVRSRTIQENYSEVIDSLVNLPAESAALIHCTNGKERTDWIVTFILAALGADRATLVEEFLKSRPFCQPYLDYILPIAEERKCTEEQIEYLKAIVGVSQKQFEDALDMIDQRYGSMDSYLTKQLGVDDTKKEQLRELFLE